MHLLPTRFQALNTPEPHCIRKKTLTLRTVSEIIDRPFMRTPLMIKTVSWVILLAMLVVTTHLVHEEAHALQGTILSSVHSSIDDCTSHQPPSPSGQQHADFDGCDTCINCACHAPLAVQQLVVHYNPIILSLGFSDPYQYLPEVYLSKFIPPQIHA